MAPSEQETLRLYREAMGERLNPRALTPLCGAPRPENEAIVCERPRWHRGKHQSGLSAWSRG